LAVVLKLHRRSSTMPVALSHCHLRPYFVAPLCLRHTPSPFQRQFARCCHSRQAIDHYVHAAGELSSSSCAFHPGERPTSSGLRHESSTSHGRMRTCPRVAGSGQHCCGSGADPHTKSQPGGQSAQGRPLPLMVGRLNDYDRVILAGRVCALRPGRGMRWLWGRFGFTRVSGAAGEDRSPRGGAGLSSDRPARRTAIVSVPHHQTFSAAWQVKKSGIRGLRDGCRVGYTCHHVRPEWTAGIGSRGMGRTTVEWSRHG
jgi:hypothetical protein